MSKTKLFFAKGKDAARLALLIGPSYTMITDPMWVSLRQALALLRRTPEEWADLFRDAGSDPVDLAPGLERVRWKHPNTEEIIVGWKELVRVWYCEDPFPDDGCPQETYHVRDCVWKGLLIQAAGEQAEVEISIAHGEDSAMRVEIPQSELGEGLAAAAAESVELLTAALRRGKANNE